MIEWQWGALQDFSAQRLYQIFAARETVFVVEQSCAYQELDGLDREALHLVAWSDAEVATYLRVLSPGARFDEPSIGRVLTTRAFRRQGLAGIAMRMALDKIETLHPQMGVRISAQSYLKDFYTGLGFKAVAGPYAEDGLPHFEMLRFRA